MRAARSVLAALALSAGLVACATPTPYQPLGSGGTVSGGYSDQRLDAEHYRVTFAGNTLTSRDTVERYLLYRAAELTVQQGGDWFELTARRTDRDRRTYLDPDPFGPRFGYAGYGYWRPSWRYYGGYRGGRVWRSWSPFYGDPFWADDLDLRTVEKFEASAEITVHRGQPPQGQPGAFNARAVMDNLGPQVQRPAT